LLSGRRRRFPCHEVVQRLAGFVRDKFDKARVIDETWKRAPFASTRDAWLPGIAFKKLLGSLADAALGDKIGFLWLNMWWATYVQVLLSTGHRR
jgi:hypothetical protein